MPSHLTRHVFRRLLANEPIVHRGCLRRQRFGSIAQERRHLEARQRPNRSSGIYHGQRRTIFSFGSMFAKKREPAGASMDPGMEKMMELEKMERLKARLPPPEEVAQAMASFAYFRHRGKGDQPGMADNQAQLVLQSLRYCLRCEAERRASGSDRDRILGNSALRHASQALRGTGPKSLTSVHVELASALYETITSRASSSEAMRRTALLTYIHTLARSGSPQEALDVTMQLQFETAENRSTQHDRSAHSTLDDIAESDHVEGSESNQDLLNGDDVSVALSSVLQGFADHGPPARVEDILSMILDRGSPSSRIRATMHKFYLGQNDIVSAIKWWREGRRLMSPDPSKTNLASELWPAKRTRELLEWCLQYNEINVGHEIVQELTASNPLKIEWDAIFVWAAGTKKGVDEIDRMIGIMVSANEGIKDRSQWRLPDIDTINALVESAVSRQDPYMAERFVALGREKGIEPNAWTYALQMRYRLDVKDVDGALMAYKNLQGVDLSSNSDVPTVNRLIVALCKTQRHDFDTIMNVAADLSDRRVRFEADTVTTLSLLHLRRDERHDVVDLLNTHAYHFSSTEREGIRNAMVAFALDPETPTASAWDAYTILRELFDEMPRTQRTELMTSFVRRERADMAVRVFQNMRMHSRADTMPTIDTYVAAFMALAKARDLDSLELVHNQLKLDYNINTSTYLLNTLIIAYTACGKPRFALDFWDEIAVSREGPSYDSVHVTLRACEKSPYGDLKAQEIWALLRKRGVELDQSLWASYAAALAGDGDNDLAFRTLDEAVEKGEMEIDEFVLGSLFMAGSNTEKQGQIEAWAKEKYPEVWELLEAKGMETNVVGMRRIEIDRSVAP